MLVSNVCALVKVRCYIREVAHVAVILYALLQFSEMHLFIFQPFWFSLHFFRFYLYHPRLWGSAQPTDKISQCFLISSSLFSSLPLSKARVRMHTRVCLCLCIRVSVCVHPYCIIGLDIKASYLQRVSWRQPKEYLISLHFADYLPFGIHWAEREAKPWPSKLHLICFSFILATVLWLTPFYQFPIEILF